MRRKPNDGGEVTEKLSMFLGSIKCFDRHSQGFDRRSQGFD